MDRIQIPEGMGLEEFSLGRLGKKGLFRKLLMVSPGIGPKLIAMRMAKQEKKKRRGAPGAPAPEAAPEEVQITPGVPGAPPGEGVPSGPPPGGGGAPGAPEAGPGPEEAPPEGGPPPSAEAPPSEAPPEGGPPPSAEAPPSEAPSEETPPEEATSGMAMFGDGEKGGFPPLLVIGGLALVGLAVYWFYFRKKD